MSNCCSWWYNDVIKLSASNGFLLSLNPNKKTGVIFSLSVQIFPQIPLKIYQHWWRKCRSFGQKYKVWAWMNLKWILEDLLDTFTSSVICIHMKQQNVTLNVMQMQFTAIKMQSNLHLQPIVSNFNTPNKNQWLAKYWQIICMNEFRIN